MKASAPVACAFAICLAGAAAAGQPTPEQEQAALKRARILRIIGIPGLTRSLDGTLKELGAQVNEQEVRIALGADVLFVAGRSELRPEGFRQLEQVAAVLREYPAGPVRQAHPLAPVLIESHAHTAGADASAQALSERRALSVRDWLVEHAGIDPARLSIGGQGATKPVVPNAGPDGNAASDDRRKNERIEITARKN